MQLLPGFDTKRAIFGIPKSPTQLLSGSSDIPPLPPPPTRQDPAILDAMKKQKSSELARAGRRSTILTGGRGVQSPLGTTNRPMAKQFLGG